MIDWFGKKRKQREEAERQSILEEERAQRNRMRELDYKFKDIFVCPKCMWWGRKGPDFCGSPWWICCDIDGRQSKCD